MSLLPKSIHWCRRYPTKFNSGRDIPMFRGEEAAKAWISAQRWPEGPFCPYCGSDSVQSNIKHKSMTHRCHDCEDILNLVEIGE